MWTLAKLERAALTLLRRPETKVRVGSLAIDKDAHSTFDLRGNHNIVMKVDSFAAGLTEGVVHELLHAVLRSEMRQFDNEVEEIIILGLEDKLVRKINRSKFKLRVWRNAITHKMEE